MREYSASVLYGHTAPGAVLNGSPPDSNLDLPCLRAFDDAHGFPDYDGTEKQL